MPNFENIGKCFIFLKSHYRKALHGSTKISSEFYSSLCFACFFSRFQASQVAVLVKNLPAVQETWVRSLGWEDPLEKEMANHSNILAQKIPWTEDPGRLQSLGSQESDMTQRPPTTTTSLVLVSTQVLMYFFHHMLNIHHGLSILCTSE